MKFGIFFEMSTPRPFTADVEATVYHNTLEQARLADELGFDWVWAVEHHFLEEYSHCSAPEVVLAAVAAQTERIRIGHGAVVCVPEMNHPIRVAERCAALDIISRGRLEVGTARSSTWTELGGFNVDPDATKKTWDEFVRALPKLWGDGHASWEGSAFSMPERNVLPKPVQKPHPPMWVTVTSPGTECDAADRGLGCLGVAAAGYAEQERRTAEYFRRIEQCDPVGGIVTREVTTLNFLFCHEDPATAASVGMGLVGAFGLANSHLLWTREAYPTRAYQSLGNLAPGANRGASGGGPGDAYGIPEGIGVGDPDIIGAAIERWESQGVTGINFLLNALETVPQEQVLDSMRLFAREVMPRFREPVAAGRPLMLTGTAPLDELLSHAATMASFDTEALTLPDVEVFQAMFESHIGGREASLPPSLHPTAVPTFIFQVWRCRDTPWGPFSLAQGRVGARSGLRPRGHMQGCVCDNDVAVDALRARWGFPARLGVVTLRHHYDAVEGSVEVDGNTVVSIRGAEPEPLGNNDVAYSQTVALANTPRGLRLVQIEYDIAATRAERLRPRLEVFDAARFGMHPSVQPYHAVSSSIALGSIELHRLRFVCRPDEIAFTGTEPIDQ